VEPYYALGVTYVEQIITRTLEHARQVIAQAAREDVRVAQQGAEIGRKSGQPTLETSPPVVHHPQREAKGVSPAQIRQAQERLKEKGFDPGSVDGSLGPRTKAALRQYQTTHGLPVTGELDGVTLKALGI
jgi:hypothetical protein